MTGSYHRAMPRDPSEPRRGRGRRPRPRADSGGTGTDAGGRGESAGSDAGPQATDSDGRHTPTSRTGRGSRSRPRLQRVDETSAGGLVLDLAGEIPRGAIIGRTDRRGRLLWSLPKGHVEPGETPEEAAVREVAEETGIAGEILGSLGTIDFWFIADGRRIHKTVHHFLLRAVGGQLSDADIEVTEVEWVPLPRIADRLAYPDERDLIDAAGRLLAESA